MKRMLMMFALLPLLALADTWTDPSTGITWTYTVSQGEAIVGRGSSSNPAIPKSTTGAITIPSTLGDCPVTSIGGFAFYGCSGLKSVTMSADVTSIGDYAFADCSGLTSVTIPAGVTNISKYAFVGCSGIMSFVVDDFNQDYLSVNGLLLTKDGTILIAGVNGAVVISGSVTSIGDYAFAGCSGLTSATIPSSVASIGNGAFYDCSGLTSVTIPAGVTSIGDAAFYGCSGLTSVTISASVTSIGKDAFSGCCGLTSVAIPANVTSIGSWAFRDCSGLTSVTIPNSVTSIGDSAFSSCSGLTSVTIPSGVTGIGDGVFCDCFGLTSVTIPSSVTSIGGGAFAGCSGLTSVMIPSSVTSIGGLAFAYCSGLTSVTIAEGMTSIGDAAFFSCSGLTNVSIPSSVTSVGLSAFYGSDLASFDFGGLPPEGVVYAGISQGAAVRYNIMYEDEWLPVVKECGFTNARPYVPGVGDITKADIDMWVGSTLALKFKGAGETVADYRKRFEAKFGEDCVAAFFRETGKVGRDETNLQVWHDYVAGTDPLNTNDVFTATITVDEKGVPKVEFKPTFEDASEAAKRKYTTLGKKSLADEKWEEVAEGREADYNFFKVTVEMAE